MIEWSKQGREMFWRGSFNNGGKEINLPFQLVLKGEKNPSENNEIGRRKSSGGLEK